MDGLEPLSVTVTTHIGKATSNLARSITQFSASLATNAANLISTVGNKVSIQADILKGNASGRWDNFTQAVSEKLENIKAGVEIAAEEEGKSVAIKWIEAGLGGDLSDPITLFGGGRSAGVGLIVRTERQLLKKEIEIALKLRNGGLAGKVHPKTGIKFDSKGFPDFSNSLYKGGVNDVMIKPTGNRLNDFDAANKAAGYKSKPKGYTWHHHQSRGRMQLVEENIHSQTGHTGGFSLW